MIREGIQRVIRHEEQERLIGIIEWYREEIDSKETRALLEILIKTIRHNETDHVHLPHRTTRAPRSK